MGVFLITVTALDIILLIGVASMQPRPGLVSSFELGRRAKQMSRDAKAALRREKHLPDIIALLRSVVAILLVVATVLLIVSLGWAWGVVTALLLALLYGSIARVKFIHRLSHRLYQKLEPRLVNLSEKSPGFFRFIRGADAIDTDAHHRFDSREELQRLIEQAEDVLTRDERTLITHALAFPERQVKSIMTPRRDIKTIKKSEFLGPLVLSELHELGHSRLPVIAGSLDHVVGILHLQDLLSLDIKQSVTAEKAMEAKVHYIYEEDSLERALATFVKTHHHLLIVINDARETVGLITLHDVISALLGRRISEEDADD